jgi:Ca2+-binding RTX toxin-like protein
VTFTLVVKVSGNTPNGADIANTATVAAGNEPVANTGNNSATTHTTAQAQLDFGDAPASYGTLLADDGPRHVILNGLHMGSSVDFEINGQPNATATGDDNSGSDDEDGVTLPGELFAGRNAVVFVNASAVGKLDAWIDFGRDGHFDPTDRIANSLVVTPGSNAIHFAVPADAVAGGTFARFRISTAGGLGPTGLAADGEVEDYATTIGAVAPGTVVILPNPEVPGQSQLSIEGTAGKDTITVTQLRSFHLLLQVTMNGHNKGSFSMGRFQSILVYAGSGDDTVTINPGMSSSVHGEDGNDRLTTAGGFDELFGGAGNDTLNAGGGDDYLEGDDGNDTLIGGTGNDALLGGAGNDSLSGGAGRDLLIGGVGVDRLSGDAGDDILIGGATANDNNRTAINQIMATWSSNRFQFATRVSQLSPLLNPATVLDDGVKDRLDGGADKDHDWFIDFLAADQIVNFNSKYDRKN